MNWDLVWGAFLAIGGLGFLALQLTGASDRPPDGSYRGTLSATLRRWLGINPPAPRRWVFGGLFAALVVWFGLHILTPWV